MTPAAPMTKQAIPSATFSAVLIPTRACPYTDRRTVDDSYSGSGPFVSSQIPSKANQHEIAM
jgi:hypothetical protein